MFLQAPLFEFKHLIGVAIVFLFFLIVSTFLRKNNYDNKDKVIIAFTIIFYILEIVKIGYIIYLDKAYPIYQLPLHLCSLPLYLYPLMLIFKKSDFVNKYIIPAAYSLVMIAGIMALALPTNILGNDTNWLPLKDNILPIISFFYHGLMVFSSIYLLKSRYYNFKMSDYSKSMAVGIAFAGMAMIANALLDKDFMLLNYGTGSPLAFILEISKPLYVFSMIGGFAILIGFVVVITDLLTNKVRLKKRINS